MWRNCLSCKAINTRYYRHVLAALGNTDVPALEEFRVVWAHKMLLALESDLPVLLRIWYTKGVRLGMETRYPGRSIYGYPISVYGYPKVFKVWYPVVISFTFIWKFYGYPLNAYGDPPHVHGYLKVFMAIP